MNFPGYIIRRRLGAGGQAIVYLATQQSLDRPVALKVLHPRFADSDQFTARFLNEGRLVANLDHANVVTIHDIGVAGELHFLSMELVEGGDLKQRIRAGLAVETILDYLITIADCLTVVHDKHIVHRDIKPENVLFRRDGTLLLTDFGIAKHLHLSNDLTVSGTTLGSPNYLSPEQAKGQPLDGRADLYSLGAMAYEMFTGERPYSSPSEFDTVFMHVNAPLPRLPERLARFQPIIDGTMAKSPDDRLDNADRLADLLRALRGLPAGVEPTLLPVTSLTAIEELVRRDPRQDLPAAATDVNHQVVTARELTRTEGTRLPLVIVAVLSLFLVATWLRVPVDGSVETVAVDPRPTRTASPVPVDTPVETVAMDPGPTRTPSPVAVDGPVETVTVEPRPTRAQSPVALPEPATTTIDPAGRISGLLARAEAAMADLRLTRPRDDNALSYYRQVLAMDAGNSDALQGERRVAARYAALATAAFEDRDLDRASTMVKRGLRAHPTNIDLRTFQAKLRQARTTTLAASAPQVTAASANPSPVLSASPRELFN